MEHVVCDSRIQRNVIKSSLIGEDQEKISDCSVQN